MDGKKGEVPFCSKKHGRHPTLLPGIFTVFCQHGVCYGYQIMKSMESPNIPFPFLRTRFEDCSMGYESKLYPKFKSVNTQTVEQNNSKLKKLKSSLSYMTPPNFHTCLCFFLWNCNREMKVHN